MRFVREQEHRVQGLDATLAAIERIVREQEHRSQEPTLRFRAYAPSSSISPYQGVQRNLTGHDVTLANGPASNRRSGRQDWLAARCGAFKTSRAAYSPLRMAP
jgi:hypothetical protein